LLDEASVLIVPGEGAVGSDVTVMRSETAAKALADALASRRGRACLTQTLGSGERVEGETTVTSHTVKASFVSLAKTLGPAAIGFRVLAELPPVKIPPHLPRKLRKALAKPKATFIHVDVVFFRVGPAEIVFIAFGVKPFPAALESQALSLLYSRAETHKL
jgi:hypothetical protein